MKTITLESWRAKGTDLFGADETKWAFKCPNCSDECSFERARREFPELKGCGWRGGQECIGRYTRKAGCDWVAYGLFCGPLSIQLDDGKVIHAFDFAGEPFTKEAA
jgi:hypothetical protein